MVALEAVVAEDPNGIPKSATIGKRVLICAGLLLVIFAVAQAPHFWNGGTTHAEGPGKSQHVTNRHGQESQSVTQKVDVVHPVAGGIERVVEVPGSVRAFDHARLYARVAGFLKVQHVDIGDPVKKGQLLAELDVPELVEDVHRHQAQLGLARAQVLQCEAAIKSAIADTDVATATVQQAEAEVGRATAAKSFREKQYLRIKDLRGLKAIDERLVDEKQDEHEAAISSEQAAIAKVATAKSQVVASAAKVEQARADAEEAKAKVGVAQAELQKSDVMLQYARIVSPYDGVITSRTFHVGDFIQSADQGGGKPVLEVQKNDVMRLIAQIPDRDVAYVDVGDLAEFTVDGLGSVMIRGKVSRFSTSEEERTRSMRTEVDLKNSDGKLRDGMYGQILFHLQEARPDAVNIPSACLVGSSKKSKTKVFVCKDGKLQLIPLKIGFDNGVVVEVIEGLSVDSQVVFAPAGDLVDGSAAEPNQRKKSAP